MEPASEHGVLEAADLTEVLNALEPNVPYFFSHIYEEYARVATAAGRRPATEWAVGRELGLRGLIKHHISGKRAWSLT